MTPKLFVLDVDGVMTTGQFFYSAEGKALKVFGPDDADGLQLLKPHLEIRFISADKRGFEITRRRIADDMGYRVDLVPVVGRREWLAANCNLEEAVFMGDGIFDHYVMKAAAYSIAPQNAHDFSKKTADYVTARAGGHGAVAEACLHILEIFFEPYDPLALAEPKYT